MKRAWVYGAIGIAVAAVATTAAVALASPTKPEQPKTFELRGTLTLTSVHIQYATGTPGEPCQGMSGFRDITAGAPVTVYDSTGKTVGLGKLEAGRWAMGCIFGFGVPNVVEDEILSVEVSNRGKVNVTLDDAKAGTVELTLQG